MKADETFLHVQNIANLSADQAQRLRDICTQHGDAYDSFLNTEASREILLAKAYPGAISFCRIGRDAEALGGLCAPRELRLRLLQDFMAFLTARGLALSTFNVPDADVEHFRALNFRTTKLGEELFIDLPNHDWGGKRYWKLRNKVNQCERKGLRVAELDAASFETARAELGDVTRLQLAEKSQREALQFFVGLCPPRELGPRRVFVAKSPQGRVEAFIVLIPYGAGKAFGLDSFRIRPDAPRNVMTFLLKEAIDTLKSHGISEFSLGAAPGAHCGTPIPGDKPVIRHLVNFAYRHLNLIYDLKGVHEFKQQFRPKSRALYLSCYPDQFTVNGVYAFFKTFGMLNINMRMVLAKMFAPVRKFLLPPTRKPLEMLNGTRAHDT